MALRNQPYIPLYVQDFLTDEKLMECSAEAHGVYIRLMCLMHKSEVYGTVLLKQKDKQSNNQIINFALKIAKFMPFKIDVISSALNELLTEKVIEISGDQLVQKRMFKDGKISEIRALVGKNGGKKTQSKIREINANNFGKANNKPNSEIESEIESDINNDINLKVKKAKFDFEKAMINYGFDQQLVKDWLKVRKTKRATNTETAFKRFIEEVQKNKCDLNELLKEIVSHSWSGFKWEWLKNNNNGISTNNKEGNRSGRIADDQLKTFLDQNIIK